MSHMNAKVNEKNKTIEGGTVSHVGQLYFDQDLLDTVETVPPYNTNKQFWMKNIQDFTMASGAMNSADPVMEYVLLGKDIRDGVFAWINFGIDSKLSKKVMASAECTAEGCKSSGFMAFMLVLYNHTWFRLTNHCRSEAASGTATLASLTDALKKMGGPAASFADTLTSLAETFGWGPKAAPAPPKGSP
jgi:hypothetical protein